MNRSVKLICFFCLFGIIFLAEHPLLGNNRELDSLKIIELVKNASNLEHDGILENYNKALQLSRNSKLINAESNILYQIGKLYQRKGSFKSALDFYLQALRIAEKQQNKSFIGDLNNVIGLIYSNFNNYEKALEHYNLCLNIGEELINNTLIASAYGNIGVIYELKGNNEAAFNYYDQRLHYLLKTKDTINIIYGYITVASNKITQGKYAEAEALYFTALKIIEKRPSPDLFATVYNGLALANEKMGFKEKAFANLMRATDFIKQSKSEHKKINHYVYLGSLLADQKKISQAITYYNEALTIAQRADVLPSMKDCYLNLAQLNFTLKEYKQAYLYKEKGDQIKDSLLNKEMTLQVAELHTAFETEKKVKEIELLTKEKELQELELLKEKAERRQQVIMRNSFLGGFLLLLLVAIVLNKNIKDKKKANLLLSTQKTAIETKNREITDSINYARRLQDTILPRPEMLKEVFSNSFALYVPKDIVSGDFYWIEKVEKKLFVAVVDCTGHGVPGAFVSFVGYNGLNKVVKESELFKPSEVLDSLNTNVESFFNKSGNDIQDGMDVSFCKIQYRDQSNHKSTAELEYAGAHNPIWIYRKKEGDNLADKFVIEDFELIEIKADKQPIGRFSSRKPFTNHSLPLYKGDTIYLFTDGYADQFGGPQGKKYKLSQLKTFISSMQDKDIGEHERLLREEFERWKGKNEQLDDVCLVGIRI